MILYPAIKYRSDIDGLRALAVLSVILFHIDAKWIPGGFLGVDIFFVISGYLITLILTKEIEASNQIDIVSFYKRRIKRIFPALLFVLVPTFVVGFFFFVPDDLLSLSKSLIWSLFSVANIYFFSSIDTGYFAAGSSELPLLHLWSLGVEEQFYILWPFAVLYLLRYVNSIKKRILIPAVLFAGSLVWAQAIITTDHSFAYYMLFTRAWELMAGAMAALLVYSGFRIRGLISELMASIGLLMIILSLIFVSESDPVPGIAALPVITGATLLILSSVSYKTYIGSILSFRLFVAIGLVSYSAYLWHWPILAFLRYAIIEIDWIVAVVVIFLTFSMATLSYFMVETPLRKKNVSTKNVFLFYFAVPVIAIVALSLAAIQGIKHKSEFIFPFSKLSKITQNTLPASAYKYNCQYTSFDTKAYDENRCVYPDGIQKADAFLIGDSNAAHYLGMLRVFSGHFGFSIRNATQSGCPMVFESEFDWMDPRYKKGCSVYTHSVFNEAKKYSTVIVGGNWDDYFDRKEFRRNFEDTIKKLSENVPHVILLAKNPLFPGYNKDCEIRSIKLPNLGCENRFDNSLNEHQSNQWLREIANKYSNIEYFDVRSQLCRNGTCSPYLQGQPAYYDEGHLSMNGSELIGENMIDTNDPMLHVFDHLKGKKQTFKPHIEIKDQKNRVSFSLNPRPEDKQIAFYLYKDEKRIDTQWYSTNLTYKLDKKKFGPGKYRVRYFIVDEKEKDPGKAKKSETGFSDYVTVQ